MVADGDAPLPFPRRRRSPIPPHLFARIVGYGDVKRALRRTLRLGLPVHHWLMGPPASGKSVFMEEIVKLPGAYWIDGASATGAGIRRVVLEENPEQLIIDEVDHLDPDAVHVLYAITEQGMIRETTGLSRVSMPTDVQVFMTSNTTRRTMPALWTRFEKWRFGEYTRGEFAQVAEAVIRDMGGPPRMGTYIGKRVWDAGGRDLRAVRHVATLCRTQREVDAYLASPHRAAGWS